MPETHPLVLMILDGWGYREDSKFNAIQSAHTPQWDHWWKTQPHTLLEASGTAVGLPEGQMGNSEVGHMHIGAGRVIAQDFTRINQAINDGDFYRNPVFLQNIVQLKKSKRSLHVLGLLSPGGVHSHENHLFAFLKLCAEKQLDNVGLHLVLDGRDTPPRSALSSLERLNECLRACPGIYIRSITGRFYAMDRDKRWSRVEPVYRLLTENRAENHYDSAQEAVMAYYQQDISDEFIPPTRIDEGQPILDNDVLFLFNFRADRMRQLTHAFIDPHFAGFERRLHPALKALITMTAYAKTLPTEVAFPPLVLHNTLGEVVAQHGLTQLRAAETEKYAHVTFFLNGGIETEFPHEKRVLIQSPLVKTYDLQPAMSAPELTKVLIEAINSDSFNLIICNYANADMVGHTGNLDAAIQAIESLDLAMRDVWQALEAKKGELLITADHGNAECMFNEVSQQMHTAHTAYPVPFLYVGHRPLHFTTSLGSLIDVAPTTLKLLGLNPPAEMTGKNLLEENR